MNIATRSLENVLKMKVVEVTAKWEYFTHSTLHWICKWKPEFVPTTIGGWPPKTNSNIIIQRNIDRQESMKRNLSPCVFSLLLYIYIYIYIRVIQKIRWILFKKLPLGSIVYSCAFFMEISSDGSSYVPKDCQHDILKWRLHPEGFLYLRVFFPQTVLFYSNL